MSYSMQALYKTIGISRQAVSCYEKRRAVFDGHLRRLAFEATALRKRHPGCGVEKMYYTLKPGFIGRDRFIETFMELGFRIKRSRNARRTTYALPCCYTNLIKGLEVAAPSVVWQSDITYIECGGRFFYAVFIIDVYTKKICGYQVSDHMRATANIRAFEMALKGNAAPHIHHSDKGSQFICKDYIGLLKKHGCAISMASSAQDNAYAERINKTIKEEYLRAEKPNFKALKLMLDRAVKQYNHERPHNSLKKLSPVAFETQWRNSQLKNKPVITIFNNEIIP